MVSAVDKLRRNGADGRWQEEAGRPWAPDACEGGDAERAPEALRLGAAFPTSWA